MKQTIIILTLMLTTKSLFACLSASQNRLFPLGNVSSGLCMLETHLYRTEFIEKGKEVIEMKPAWAGISYFKIYDKNHKVVYAQIIDTITLFEEQHYDSIIGKSFEKGLSLANTYTDFEIAKPTSLTFCDYQEKCSKAALLFDTTKNKICIRLENKHTYDVNILFDSTSIASNLLNHYERFEDTVLSAKSFKGNIYINSVRQFQLGNKKLTIVHIGSGQSFEPTEGETYPPGKEFNAKFTFNDINKSVFKEDVLHHGHGFDFFIWE